MALTEPGMLQQQQASQWLDNWPLSTNTTTRLLLNSLPHT